ncbi:bifunctional 4-hydroxy-2-oxoglutarate aldolase/2-dehydro-3-deoxy-phosphogluconate aldolase [Sphingomonas sp. C3-2]|uniref:bifunctional 4-hydroxy-2-oxoglutarate aldolase/2-dehydro-3-deoxy-phosphogluconate aldolase n=1 Tax=Sphingomonas sp. C3-2 TaxID=3062169 RepID=UPI00294B8C99|nr:bifunctional 4-hydroxy-2-oxoglutarate aldolase/2-dehydro-3-deoxy-phosphogluconate aldolase [Sphingomonas sp. C3-2]WOK37607.1 bifunctional 4-hydroxy-2-oxoglutarate aldolase/2-dehydro-3-deoxy-phosphogluconate aldolase [Sphingomonas sp. C3-2]
MNPIETIMRTGPVIPVLVIDDLAHARPIAEALVAGGLSILEVTLRTPCALEAIREMSAVDGAIVGAGTVLNPGDLQAAINAGAQFVVSPGLTEPLGHAAIESRIPFLPGIANAGDIMRGLDMGLSHFKFFPAMASGGTPTLKSLAPVFADCTFCPTGGITAANAPEWLAIPQVACVGGSWIVLRGAPDAQAITAAAREAAALSG